MEASPKIVEQVLETLSLKTLNEMQIATLKAVKTHADILLQSPTGSGKTLAFLLPILMELDTAVKTTQALIVVPSRELAQQIETVWRTMRTGYKVTCCYGGHKRETEENSLVEAPALIIGTAGRLADHIRRGNITTATIKTLIVDEFDKALDLGFAAEMEEIITALPNIERRILTSATGATEVPAFVGLSNPETLHFEAAETEEGFGLAIQILHTSDKDKLDDLFSLICQLGARPTIIFCNHREAVERTSNALYERGIFNEFYHGAMEQQERDAALVKFRNGSTYFLVTTDLAARGLDIANLRYIIHYHLPHTEDAFTHRNGRTARVDKSGTAILMIGPDEKVPDYVLEGLFTTIKLQEKNTLPERPDWVTLYISAGKKNKVNKVDILGFLAQKGSLKMEDIGLIEVKDFFSFVAVRRANASSALKAIENEKLKGKKLKIELAR
ncbi:MAG: DEAD/DEAH box helicase [Chitinophagaceae bacterium]